MKKIKRFCEICNLEFFIPRNRINTAKFCSKKCLGKHNSITKRRRIKVNCFICNKELELIPSRRKFYDKNYCSRKCQHKGMLNGINKECISCKKIFYVEKCRSKKAKFCSTLCNDFFDKDGKFKRGHIGYTKGQRLVEYKKTNCLYCGKEFEQTISSNQKFCNMKCKSKVIKPMLGKHHSLETKLKLGNSLKKYWQEGDNIKKFPLYIDGRSYRGYGKWFKPLREQIRNRDDRVCQECFIVENGAKHDVHHIDYEKQNNNPINLITLCRSCHSKANINRDIWQVYYQNKMEVLYGTN